MDKTVFLNIGIQFFSDDIESSDDNNQNISETEPDICDSGISIDDSEDKEMNFETGEVISKSTHQPASKMLLISIFDVIEVFSYAMALMVVLFLFVIKFVTVDGGSMNKTLIDEDKLVIYNLFYTPEVNDVIVINRKETNELLVKRVIGVEGDKVKIDFDTWEIWVNGEALDQFYLKGNPEIGHETMNKGNLVDVDEENCVTIEVEEGKVFVLGDNRNHSSDSRVFGQMEQSEIMGKVILRVYPFESAGIIK